MSLSTEDCKTAITIHCIHNPKKVPDMNCEYWKYQNNWKRTSKYKNPEKMVVREFTNDVFYPRVKATIISDKTDTVVELIEVWEEEQQ